MGRLAPPASFVDLLGQTRSDGTAWMFQPILAKSWGTVDQNLTLRRQFDGILFVDEVHPPHYK
jgi:erythromycin esterase